LGYSVDDF
jgi:hypothetical protein